MQTERLEISTLHHKRRVACARSVSLLILAVVTAAVGACGAAVDVPLPDLTGSEPQVRAKIQQAHDAVEARPQSAETWGRYGMVLHAHDCRPQAQVAYETAARLDPKAFRWPYYLAMLAETTQPQLVAAMLETALDLEPNFAPARVRLGTAYERTDRPDEAWDQYNQAVALDPDNVTARLPRGQMALRRGSIDLAVADLEAVVAQYPSSAAALSTLAVAYQRNGQTGLARATAQRLGHRPRQTVELEDPHAIDLAREAISAQSFLDRARLMLKAGQLYEAQAHLRRGLAFAPDHATLKVALAVVLVRQGEYAAALETAREAQRANDGAEGVHRVLAAVLLRMGRAEEADRGSLLALAADPDDEQAHRIRARLVAQQGKLGEAITHLERAVQLAPDYTPSRLTLARLLANVSRFDEAHQHFQRIIASQPGHSAAWTELGAMQLRRQHNEDAIRAFQGALAVAPGPGQRSSAVRGLAQALVAQGRGSEAVTRLKAHLDRDPGDWPTVNSLAWLLATIDDPDVRDGHQAMELAERLTSDPARRNPSTLDTLAAAYAEVGRFDAAVRTMEEALRLTHQARLPGQTLQAYRHRLELYEAGQPYRAHGL